MEELRPGYKEYKDIYKKKNMLAAQQKSKTGNRTLFTTSTVSL
jgi:hypothetical protein